MSIYGKIDCLIYLAEKLPNRSHTILHPNSYLVSNRVQKSKIKIHSYRFQNLKILKSPTSIM